MPPPQGADLTGFRIERRAVGAVPFELWLAATSGQRTQGLMFATTQQVAPLQDGTPRGMLFVFPSDRNVSFFTANTYVPLDIAFIRSDGVIAEIQPLQPLDTTPVGPAEPIRYALEVSQGDFAARGIAVGNVLQLPLTAP